MADTILICAGIFLLVLGALGLVVGGVRRRRGLPSDGPDEGRTAD